MGQHTEHSAEIRWHQTCSDQGWSDESQIIHLEGFIKSKGLMTEFAAYAKEAADEENDG